MVSLRDEESEKHLKVQPSIKHSLTVTIKIILPKSINASKKRKPCLQRSMFISHSFIVFLNPSFSFCSRISPEKISLGLFDIFSPQFAVVTYPRLMKLYFFSRLVESVPQRICCWCTQTTLLLDVSWHHNSNFELC